MQKWRHGVIHMGDMIGTCFQCLQGGIVVRLCMGQAHGADLPGSADKVHGAGKLGGYIYQADFLRKQGARFLKEGKIRGLGLSNFLPHHIKNILENGTVKPVVNQLELHPGYMQQAAVQYCKEHGIQMQAWSPIGRRRILEDGLILELAGKYQVSPAQLCLRFLLQNDIIPLPKSSSMERMKQNMDLFHFEISEEDVSRLATMPQAGWSGEHPDPELAQKNVV